MWLEPPPVIPAERLPYTPEPEHWRANYEMLCKHCDKHLNCPIVEAMIAMKEGGAWPEGGWVTDPGASVTCLSYSTRPVRPLPRQQMRAMLRLPDARLPPVCGGCAARKGSEASVSLHTQRDYGNAVRNGTPFTCHEQPTLCGGWCRAVRRREFSK